METKSYKTITLSRLGMGNMRLPDPKGTRRARRRSTTQELPR